MRKIAMAMVLCLSLTGMVFAQATPLVNKIEIRGLKRIEEGAVRSRLTQRTGESVSQEKTSEDIKTIFKMGYFEDVKIELEAFEGGIRLIYALKEKPTIIKVDFQGNKEQDDTKLKEKISITPGSIADTVLIQENASKLKAFYEEEGYWLANVVPVTKKVSGEDLTLTFQIDEGQKVKLRNLTFEGNKKLSASKIKKIMDTKEWWIFSFLSAGSGYYRKDKMDADIERIRNLYYNEGYLKAIVGEPLITLDKDKKGMNVSIKISEGDIYKISGVDLRGNKAYDNETVKKLLSVTPNSVFSKTIIEKNIQAISTLYSEGGFAMVSVTPDLVTDEKNKTVIITLSINEGIKYRVGKIEVTGNTKTRDKVIRREFRFDEGELFNGSKLKRSYERLTNLNFFDSVDIAPKPRTDRDVVDLDVKVKERPTGMLSVGGGYSSVDKFIATVDVTQGNLFGRGQYLKVKGELGGKSSFYEVAFKDPWFRDMPVSLSTGIYRSTRDYTEYSKKAFGVYLGFGKDLSEYWKADISYNFERATISSIKEGASAIILDQKGTKSTSSITPSLVRDSRDNYLDPSRGSRNAVSITYAGLGGNNSFIKASGDSAWYFPLKELTYMIRGRIGYASGISGKPLPLYERYYVGGINTVRGIGFGVAGPKDPATGEAIGGKSEVIINNDFIFPLISEMRLKGVVFFDAGNSYEDFSDVGKLRYTTGAGVRWISPIGPIRIEWGYNLKKKFGESSSKVEFTFGSFF